MRELHVCDTRMISDIWFFSEICDREKMSKTLNEYITARDYVDKILLVLSGTRSLVRLLG